MREMLVATEPEALGAVAGKDRWIGYALGLFGAVFFSFKAIFIKLAYQPVDGVSVNPIEPITLMVLRMGFAFPIYAGLLIYFLRKTARVAAERQITPTPQTRRLFIGAALLGALCYYLCAFLDFTGLQYITAQLERMLLFTYPVFVMILGALFFNRRISRYGVLSIVIAYSGIGVIFAGGDVASGSNVALGTVLILLTAVFFAIFQLSAVRYIAKLGSEIFTCVAMMSASGVVFVHFLAVNGGDISPIFNLPLRLYGLGILLATVSTLIPSFMVNLALGRIGAQSVATLGMLGPVATIVFAVTLLGEPFGSVDFVGTLIVLGGIGIYTVIDRKPQPGASKSNPSNASKSRAL